MSLLVPPGGVAVSQPWDAGYGKASATRRLDIERCELLEPELVSVVGPTPIATISEDIVLCTDGFVYSTSNLVWNRLFLADHSRPPLPADSVSEVSCVDGWLVWHNGSNSSNDERINWVLTDGGVTASRGFDGGTSASLTANGRWTLWVEYGADGGAGALYAIANAPVADGGQAPTRLDQGDFVIGSTALDEEHASWVVREAAQETLVLYDMQDGGMTRRAVPAETRAVPVGGGIVTKSGTQCTWEAWP